MTKIKIGLFSLLIFTSFNAISADFNAASLSLYWCLPFLFILLSLAFMPMLVPNVWHHHYGKILACWTISFMLPFSYYFGIVNLSQLVTHAIIEEYIPFLLLLLTLYTVSGGIYIKSNQQGTPFFNICILLIGAFLASVMGTTGAAMLLIRPLLRANNHRRYRTHTVIFFIFLVANIGGGLTPLGDPPLFIGFLKGVDFFWTVKSLILPILFTVSTLLIIYYFIDSYFYKKEKPIMVNKNETNVFAIEGKFNFLFIMIIIGLVLISGIWKSNFTININGVKLELQNLLRDISFIAITLLSLKLTSKNIRSKNEFNWDPIIEVSKLFLGIFITITPVIGILKAGENGSLSSLVAIMTNENGDPINTIYFWITGMLSGFLDNAPTYLVFFNLASGDANLLMNELSATLVAISMGSVFMGALTYIGNAPNLMVKNIALQNKVKMPSFWGYMKWSLSILIPVFILNSLIFI